jgi:nucleoside-triphosphatase THEP1
MYKVQKKQLDDSWLKAAVIGSIWAAFEIVFGSFFHSLRLPFAGTFLTFFSIILLITFSYKWNGKNLFIKAGIIAALMRSMMPTSVILGPLIGILTEAFIFQLAINLLGRNLLAFSLAGTLAMFSAITHKVVSIILIYGFDIVEILKNLYYVFLHTIKIQLPLERLLWLVVVSYTALGITAAIIGMYLGKNSKEYHWPKHKKIFKLNVQQNIFELPDFYYRPGLIFFHLFFLVAFLFALEVYPIQYVILPVIFYLLFLFYRYGKSLRRLAKPVFWIQLVIIVIMAILLWEDREQGLWVGIKMVLRAILVVSVFTAISVELKNPLVKSLLYKKGYSQLYATLGLATSSIPYILKNLSVDKKDFFNPFKILKKSIALADDLLKDFSYYMRQQNKIYIISGETRSGKTTFLKSVVSELKNKDQKVGGIVAHGIDKNGERFGFEIENVETGQKSLLCSREFIPGSIPTGRFYFYKKGFEFGKKALIENLENLDWLVIDEVGYLELKGDGWFESIEKAMKQSGLNMIWIVRKRILEEVLNQWPYFNFYIMNVNTENLSSLKEEIIHNITPKNKPQDKSLEV